MLHYSAAASRDVRSSRTLSLDAEPFLRCITEPITRMKTLQTLFLIALASFAVNSVYASPRQYKDANPSPTPLLYPFGEGAPPSPTNNVPTHPYRGTEPSPKVDAYAAAYQAESNRLHADPKYLPACQALYYAEIAWTNAKANATKAEDIKAAQDAVNAAAIVLEQIVPAGRINVWYGMSDIMMIVPNVIGGSFMYRLAN